MCLRRTFFIVVGLLLVTSLIGCAGLPRQAFNKSASRDMIVIGVLEPAHSGEYTVWNRGHAGLFFGPIGSLIAGADMMDKTERFTKLAKACDFKAVEEFQSDLIVQLENVGYQVKTVKVVREKPDFLEAYDGLDRSVDAYLDTAIFVGYICTSSASDYIPTVNVNVRLIRRDTNDILYQDMIAYGRVFVGDAVPIAAEQKYCFDSYDKLETDTDKAVEGLRKGLPMVARRIALDLAR